MNHMMPIAPAPAQPYEPSEPARRYAQASKSAATVRAYGAALRSFETWCHARGLVAVPAAVSTVADFLSAEADSGRKVSSIAQKAAAIRWAHKTAGLPSPTEAEAVQNVMRGIRRSVGVAPKQKAPATAECILTILAHVPATSLVGKRDRALLLLGFAGAFRRSEVAGLLVEDLAFGDNGVDITIRKSKTDQEGRGQAVAIPHGVHLKPVEALKAWLDGANIKSGPVFRSVTSRGKVGEEAITGHTVANVVKRYAGRAGLFGDALELIPQVELSQFLDEAGTDVGAVERKHHIGGQEAKLAAADKDLALIFHAGEALLPHHGKFRAECLNQHWFLSLDDARQKMEEWR